jgi:hypothetical protein
MTKRTRYFMLGSGAFLVASLTVGLAAYYGGVRGFAQPAGPEELNYVPSDAVAVAYANVGQLMASEFRHQVKDLQPGESDQGQAEFKNATGIDIEHDIDYVVACLLPGAAGDPANQPNGFVLAHGRFDQGKIEALIREKGGVEQDYNGKRIFVHGQPTTEPTADIPATHTAGQMGVTFVSGQVAAIGTPAALKRVIDLQSGAAAPNVTGNKELMDMIGSVNSGNTWAVARFDVLRKHAQLPEQMASQLPAITWVKASGHVNGGVSGMVAVEARDQASADNLRQVVSGLKALAALQAGSKPELTSLLQSIQIGGEGSTVSVSFAVPSTAIELLKNGMKAHHVGH